MDTSLLDSLPDIVTEDNIGLFERLRADVKEAKLSEVLNDPDVLALLDRMETLDREKIRSLMADVNELREIDTDRLADVIGMLGGADQLAALLKGSTALAGPGFGQYAGDADDAGPARIQRRRVFPAERGEGAVRGAGSAGRIPYRGRHRPSGGDAGKTEGDGKSGLLSLPYLAAVEPADLFHPG